MIAAATAACSEPKREGQPPPTGKVEEWTAIASSPQKSAGDSSLVELQLQVTVTDGNGATASDTFALSVRGFTGAPVIVTAPQDQRGPPRG